MILLIDCDETLYPHSTGIMKDIGALINQFMIEVLNYDQEEVRLKRRFYIDTYGTTLNGLIRHEDIDPQHYCQYVHRLDLEKYIHPNPELPKVLKSINYPKILFTNAPKIHAERILELLNITDCFDGGFFIEDFNYESKPKLEVFELVDNKVRNKYPDFNNVVLVDDYLRNLQSAKIMNWNTVWVGESMPSGLYDETEPIKTHYGTYTSDEIYSAVDIAIPSILDLPQALDKLQSVNF